MVDRDYIDYSEIDNHYECLDLCLKEGEQFHGCEYNKVSKSKNCRVYKKEVIQALQEASPHICHIKGVIDIKIEKCFSASFSGEKNEKPEEPKEPVPTNDLLKINGKRKGQNNLEEDEDEVTWAFIF